MADPIPFPKAKRPAPVDLRGPYFPSLSPEQMQILKDEFAPPARRALAALAAAEAAMLALAPPVPPRAILRRTARDAYRRGIEAARNQHAAQAAIVTVMPGRCARHIRRIDDWLHRDGHRDALYAAVVGAGTILSIAAAVWIAVGGHP